MLNRLFLSMAAMAFVFILTACSSYNHTKYYLPEQKDQRLPALKFPFDKEASALGLDFVRYDFSNNLCESDSEYESGYALISVTGGAKEWGEVFSNRLLVLLSGFTATAVNLLGVPMGKIPAEVYIEVQIYDSDFRDIGHYQAYGKGSAYIAYFYGYTEGNAGKAAFSEALNEAQTQIREQIRGDRERLRKELLTAGPITAGDLDSLFAVGSELAYGINLQENQRRDISDRRINKVKAFSLGQQILPDLNSLNYIGQGLFGILSYAVENNSTEIRLGYCQTGRSFIEQWIYQKSSLASNDNNVQAKCEYCYTQEAIEKCRIKLIDGKAMSLEWME